MSTIACDFDYTLSPVVTLLVRNMQRCCVQDLGFGHHHWQEAYTKTVQQGFSLDVLCVEILRVAPTLALEYLKEIFTAHLLDGFEVEDGLYPDVVGAFRAWHDAGHEVLIVTRGNKHWQEWKIEAVGLFDHIERGNIIYVGTESKAEMLAKRVTTEDAHVVFVDDNPAELDTMLSYEWPQGIVCETFRVDRRGFIPANEVHLPEWQEHLAICAKESRQRHRTINALMNIRA